MQIFMSHQKLGCFPNFTYISSYCYVIQIKCLTCTFFIRWALIAGRIPGRKPEEIERYWIMKHGEGFAKKKKEACKDFWRRC